MVGDVKINFLHSSQEIDYWKQFFAHVQTHVELNSADRYLARVSGLAFAWLIA